MTPSATPSITRTRTPTRTPTATRTPFPNLAGYINNQDFSFNLSGTSPDTYGFTPSKHIGAVLSAYITDDPPTQVLGVVLPAKDATSAAYASTMFGLSSYVSGGNIYVVIRRSGTQARILHVQYLYSLL